MGHLRTSAARHSVGPEGVGPRTGPMTARICTPPRGALTAVGSEPDGAQSAPGGGGGFRVLRGKEKKRRGA